MILVIRKKQTQNRNIIDAAIKGKECNNYYYNSIIYILMFNILDAYL